MPVTSSEYPSVQNTKLQPVPWNPVTPNNLKAGFLAFPVWFKILTVVFDHWMICLCRFIFHCYKHYSSWSLTTELPLLDFHCWIIPVGLSPLNHSSWSFTVELPLLLLHCWITLVDCRTWITPIGRSSLYDLILQWCVFQGKKKVWYTESPAYGVASGVTDTSQIAILEPWQLTQGGPDLRTLRIWIIIIPHLTLFVYYT